MDSSVRETPSDAIYTAMYSPAYATWWLDVNECTGVTQRMGQRSYHLDERRLAPGQQCSTAREVGGLLPKNAFYDGRP